MFSSFVYTVSPQRVQEGIISARARVRRLLREGKTYRAYVGRVLERELWTYDQLRNYRDEKLLSLLRHAAQSIPYYSSVLKQVELDSVDLDSTTFISKIPELTKKSIIQAGNLLVARGPTIIKIKGSTSGTTGTPVTIVQDLPAISRENAFLNRQLRWAGYTPGDPRIWLRGDMVVPSDQLKSPFWRRNRTENMLMMSSYHLSEDTAPLYLRAISDFKATIIQAYPSSISFLARYLASTNSFYESDQLRSIVTSSESMTTEDRSLIQERFGCKVFDWYGAFERVAAIGTCEAGTYHLMSDYSFTEFRPADNGLFEIIGTGFNNYVMPLIRYRTGDLVELPTSLDHCACGRSFPIIEQIHGRQDDYLKLPDGRRIGRMDHIFKGIAGIAEAQIVQEDLTCIRIQVVPFDEFSDSSRRALIHNTVQRLGQNVKIEVELVSRIPRTSNGKFRSVVCNV